MRFLFLTFLIVLVSGCGKGLPNEQKVPHSSSLPTIQNAPEAAPSRPSTTPPISISNEIRFSGGLGLSRASWESVHQLTEKENSVISTYDNKRFWVTFHDENVGHLECSPLDGGSMTLDQARQVSKQYIPKDARFIKTYISRNGATVDLYNSKFLIPRFKPVKIKGTIESPWTAGNPGDFIVILRNQTGSVKSFVIGIGNNP